MSGRACPVAPAVWSAYLRRHASRAASIGACSELAEMLRQLLERSQAGRKAASSLSKAVSWLRVVVAGLPETDPLARDSRRCASTTSRPAQVATCSSWFAWQLRLDGWWKPVLDSLPAGWRAYAIDLRGCGRTESSSCCAAGRTDKRTSVTRPPPASSRLA